ncbi:MAG: ABC transporter permease subunit [Candidatus Aminicenantes bacterium]|nr:ABC transporter permease subunit [Candidatus Aminicenantes bacterium]
MTIKEKGYAHWDGKLQEKRFPWFPITRLGIKLAFKKKYFKFLFSMTLVPAIIYLAGIYASERLEDFRFMISESALFIKITPAYFNSYYTNDFILFMIVMIMVFAGAGLISDDLKYNALQLYFSRPLSKKDYIFGKASVIVFFMFIVTIIPGVVFFIMKLIFSGSFKFLIDYPWLILSIFGYSLILIAFFSFYTLFLSSLSKNRRYVTVLIFGLYVFSDILYGIFYGNFHNHYFSLLSIKCNIKQIGAYIFNQNRPLPVPWIYSFLVLLFICIVAGIVLNKRVKGVEIVK